MSLPDHTYYGFQNCVGAFFEMPTSDARALLPSHLEPLEMQHTRSILALTAFEFTQSEVGEYEEIVLAVIVPPRLRLISKSLRLPFTPLWSGLPPKHPGYMRSNVGTYRTI